MSSNAEDFNAKYTNANLAPDATEYNPTVLCGLVGQLENADGGSINAAAPGIIVRELSSVDENEIILTLSTGFNALCPTPRRRRP